MQVYFVIISDSPGKKKTTFNLNRAPSEVVSVKDLQSTMSRQTHDLKANVKKKTSMLTGVLMPPKDDVKFTGIRRNSKFTGMIHPENNVKYF
jgi:hypothetical protein